MEVIYLLIPVALLLVVVIIAGFFWAIRSGQFDDLAGPAHSILMDDEDTHPIIQNKNSQR
ncbi:MAG: cbb3-type cytochrome oxidase assembly protein CcoS [Gammaproteobacteria bacterium]|nr:cbb3-type cytochrome oxidase assembly protein CcoS [Gammaproteobacteria bacterium]